MRLRSYAQRPRRRRCPLHQPPAKRKDCRWKRMCAKKKTKSVIRSNIWLYCLESEEKNATTRVTAVGDAERVGAPTLARSLTHTHTHTHTLARACVVPTWWLAASTICYRAWQIDARELAGRYARRSTSDGARPSDFVSALPARRSYLVLSVRWATRITVVNCASLRRCSVSVGSSAQSRGGSAAWRSVALCNGARPPQTCSVITHWHFSRPKIFTRIPQTFSRGERKSDVRTSTSLEPRSRAFRPRVDNTTAVLFSRARHEKRSAPKFSERSKRINFRALPVSRYINLH